MTANHCYNDIQELETHWSNLVYLQYLSLDCVLGRLSISQVSCWIRKSSGEIFLCTHWLYFCTHWLYLCIHTDCIFVHTDCIFVHNDCIIVHTDCIFEHTDCILIDACRCYTLDKLSWVISSLRFMLQWRSRSYMEFPSSIYSSSACVCYSSVLSAVQKVCTDTSTLLTTCIIVCRCF